MSHYGIELSKPPRFQDIPQFNLRVAYSVDVGWSFLKKWMATEFGDADLDMDPDFQRGHVWTHDKKIAFVEFMLRGGESAKNIYFNCPGYMSVGEHEGGYGDYVLVDGKQRLTAVLDFLDNKVEVFGGNLYSDFADRINPMSPRLRMNVNNLKTRAEVLQWYLDLNTGGVVHSKAEIAKVKRLLAKEKEAK